MRPLKFLFRFLASTVLVFCLYRFCHHQTDGFSVKKIRAAFAPRSSSISSSFLLEEETGKIKQILEQPLKYIGRGGQCYAFSTEDGKYVVKLLKYNNNYPKIWFRLFPFPFGLEQFRQEKIAHKKQKLEGEYQSYQIALKDLKEETGIVYMHFEQGLLPGVRLSLFDKTHVHYVLAADRFQFYIQKKGAPLYPALQSMAQKGEVSKLQCALHEMASYLINRTQKKIIDKDKGIWRNFAVDEGHPFQIDIGQFVYEKSFDSFEERKKHLLCFTKEFRHWLHELDPSLDTYFTQSLIAPEEPQP